MGIFDGAAKAKAGGQNPQTAYFTDKDYGDGTFVVESMIAKHTKKGKDVVITTFCNVSHEAMKPGEVRQHIYNPTGAKTPGAQAVRDSEFKALFCAAARIPVAEENVREAVTILLDRLGIDKPQFDPSDEDVEDEYLVTYMGKLLMQYMGEATAGEGTTFRGNPVAVSVYPNEGKDGKEYTNLRFSMEEDADKDGLIALVESGDLPVADNVKEVLGLAA